MNEKYRTIDTDQIVQIQTDDDKDTKRGLFKISDQNIKSEEKLKEVLLTVPIEKK